MATTTGDASPLGHVKQSQPLVIIASSLGAVFEWYDFYLYGLLATIITAQFFSGVNETTGFIFALAAFAAGFAALKIGWTDTIRSTFMGSYQSADYPDGIAVTGLSNARSYGGAANLFWSPGKGFDIGVEYRHAVRELVSGDTGALDRLEFAFKYGF